MTNPPRSALLRVEADLRIDVDGQSASLVGQGQRLTLTAQAPGQMLAALRSAPVPAGLGHLQGVRALGRLADALGREGLEFHVAGPDGELVHLGTGAHSWWGRMVTGSSLIGVRNLRGLVSLAIPTIRSSPLLTPRVLVPTAGVGITAAGVAFVRALLRRRTPGAR